MRKGTLHESFQALCLLALIKLSSITICQWIEEILEPLEPASSPAPLPMAPLRSSTPYPSPADFDPAQCADLHNQIIEAGWRGSHPTDDAALRTRTTWWDKYGPDAPSVFPAPLVEFLKRAELGDEARAFTYHVRGLAYPDALSMWYGIAESEDEDGSVVLYESNAGGHAMGILFNYELNRAVFYPDICDHEAPAPETAGRAMLPLATILEAYLEMIETGKMVALPDDAEDEFEGQLRKHPWALRPYVERNVDLAVEEFGRLVDAIATRTPQITVVSKIEAPLIEAETLDALGLPAAFLRSFLSRAPRPPFKHIAPGLTFPTSFTLHSLMRTLNPDESMYRNEDIAAHDLSALLFPASPREYVTPPYGKDIQGSAINMLSLNHKRAGLYLSSQNPQYNDWANGVVLVLSLAVGGENGWARTADGKPLLDASEESYTGIYQSRHNPFVDNHPVALDRVLRSWTKMVEMALWEVDEEGVVGGEGRFHAMEKWREVDLESRHAAYMLDMHW